jgi:hypothetical protein
MTHADLTGPAPLAPRPPIPSITESVLIESRLFIQAVAAWLTKG